jgi:hypothetical protein
MRRATAVLVLAAMLAIGGPAAFAAAHQPRHGSRHEPRHEFRKVRVPPGMAVYEWHNAGDLAPDEVQRRLRFLRANGFHTVYLEIGNYLEAAELEDEGLLRGIRRQMQRFVATATGYGLSVQALGGGPDWFGDDRRYLGQLLVDGRGDAPGPVEFGEETKPAAYHLIDLISDLRGAYLVVMAYRDFTRTSDGSIAHARDEFRYAAGIGARSGLIVGQQYGPAAPEEQHITFHGQPRWVFRRAAAEIAVAFRRYPQFRGLSVDDIDAFMAAAP